MNDALKAIRDKSALNFKSLFDDLAPQIQGAMQQVEDGKAFTLSHSVKIDIGKDKQIDKLGFSMKTEDEIECGIPDPNQPELAGIEEA